MSEDSPAKPKRSSRAKPVSGDRPAAGPGHHAAAADRLPGDEAFARFAARVARGEIVVPPLLLPRRERRRHVRRTLMEDHRYRLHNRPEAVAAKFEAMAGSAFRFFRGAALLYYRDYAGTDADLPVVLCLGDVHPANFGVMPSADGTPVFGPNDFDEARFAPFSYDVKRGAVGFDLAAREAGLKRADRRRAVEAFARGYLAALEDFARSDREAELSMRIDNSPPMIRTLLEAAMTDRRDWLAKLVDLDKSQFRPTEEIVPLSSRVEEFQAAVDGYRKENDLGEAAKLTNFQVKDVALKKGSGTASLGLERYFVLIDGPTDDVVDDLILEMKLARRSALAGLVPNEDPDAASEADRVVTAHRVHVAGGDPYYGTATLEGKSFLVRERSPFKKSVDFDDLDADGWAEYADVCGRVLALA
ncbi:MAG TPA: DUF2252 family protein, partial [Planctomycetaceae bacterium]